MEKRGVLVISLDFELLWGVFDEVHFRQKADYFNSTTKSIPKVLELFREYEIHCTWATVGMLFLEDWEEWNEQKPLHLPSYKEKKLSSYDFIENHKRVIPREFCFAPELIRTITKYPHQEIGTHTYSHFYCKEEGQTLEQFEDDLKKAIQCATKLGINLKSLVFPRNQLNFEYLAVCKTLGINSVRSNPDNWYWNNPESPSFLDKLFRTGDAYNIFNLKKSYFMDNLQKNEQYPLIQTASRFLRPVEDNKLLRKLKMRRIKSEMFDAAKNQKIYHLWWHPHNFGNNPKESLEDLKEILDYYQFCKLKFDFASLTMDELYEMSSKVELSSSN